MIILDTSFLGPLVLPDEQPGMSHEAAIAAFATAIVVPAHWWLEVANMLRTAVRRNRITPDSRAGIFRRLASLSVETDRDTAAMAWSRTIDLSDRHGLTPYDAAYLELAARRGATLATLDRALIAAAHVDGIPLLAGPS